MRKLHVDDLVYQVATLVLSFLIVHVPYTLVVRPNAQAVLEEQARRDAARIPSTCRSARGG